MKVGIIGWYGSETIGDRAILDGILLFLNQKYGKVDIFLGSLNPYFTKRVLLLDGTIYTAETINVFDVRSGYEINKVIRKVDMLIFGGGPLMDSVSEIELMANIFRKAHRKGKKTVIFGCGLQESLPTSKYGKWLSVLIKYSDLIMWRDEQSAQIYKKHFGHTGIVIEDPAILSILAYIRCHKSFHEKEDYIAINFRNIELVNCEIEAKLRTLVLMAKEKWKRVILVPMNDFYWGGDDRSLFDRMLLDEDGVEIVHRPINLYETYQLFQSADACVGMRYHSVVFQCFLNGNNCVLDYTCKGTRKIRSFLEMIDRKEFYKDRNFEVDNLENGDISKIIDQLYENQNSFNLDEICFESVLERYNLFWDRIV